jgi:hypothetical protein
MTWRAIASRKMGSIRNNLHAGSMPNGQTIREDACHTTIIAGKEVFVAPNAVVYPFVRETVLVDSVDYIEEDAVD